MFCLLHMKLSTDEVTDIIAPQVLEFLRHTFLTMTGRNSSFLTVIKITLNLSQKNGSQSSSFCFWKYFNLSFASGMIVSLPGFQPAGQTSPCLSVYWNAWTKRSVSSTSLKIICLLDQTSSLANLVDPVYNLFKVKSIWDRN